MYADQGDETAIRKQSETSSASKAALARCMLAGYKLAQRCSELAT